MDSQGDNADRDLQGKLGGAFAQNKHFQGGGRGWVAEVAYSVPNFKKKQYLMVMAWIWMNIHVMRDDVDGIRKRLNPLQVSGSPLCGGGQLRHRWVLRQEQRRSLRRLDRDGPGSHKF